MKECRFCHQPKTGNHYKTCRVLKNVLALPPLALPGECACGCGKPKPPHDRWGRACAYLRGHAPGSRVKMGRRR